MHNDKPRRGEQHHGSKLTSDTVGKIREAIESGETQTAIARRFGVSAATISAVKTGRYWRHVAKGGK